MNRAICPDCGLFMDDPHRCALPLLLQAVGLELTEQQHRYIRWLAREDSTEFHTVAVFSELFLRIRDVAFAAGYSAAGTEWREMDRVVREGLDEAERLGKIRKIR